MPVWNYLELKSGNQGVISNRGGTVELAIYHWAFLLENHYGAEFIVINSVLQEKTVINYYAKDGLDFGYMVKQMIIEKAWNKFFITCLGL
jgi:hypothetical protein